MTVERRKHVQPFFDARGRLLIERRGLPGSSLANDAYHFLRSASWKAIAGMLVVVFLVTNAGFATVLWLGRAKITNATGFLDDFWFSVQSLATIGYGVLAPADTLSNAVVTVESIVGMLLTAMVTGIVFARFSRPSARIIFSSHALIAEHAGKRTLMFRVANARATAIVEATLRVYLSRDEVLASGERVRRIHDMTLTRSISPIFALSWVAYHVIDDTSPLHGVTLAELAGSNVIVTFQGLDDSLASSVHSRYSYNPEDILEDHHFVDIIRNDPETAVRYLDFAQFHATRPVSSI